MQTSSFTLVTLALHCSCCLALFMTAATGVLGGARPTGPHPPLRVPATNTQSQQDEYLIECALQGPSCEDAWSQVAPEVFQTRFQTTAGAFTVHVNSSWAPVMAQRFYTLSLLNYFDGGPFYRVLRNNVTEHFVAQWGYRGVGPVDTAWTHWRTSNATEPVDPSAGNRRGTVAFGTDYVANDGSNPDCTASKCSQGFSVELFVNLRDNSARLDASDFSPFGMVTEEEMTAVVDKLYAGYGECSDFCAQADVGTTDPYCHRAADSGGGGGEWLGVNLTDMILHGFSAEQYPLCDTVLRTTLLSSSPSAPRVAKRASVVVLILGVVTGVAVGLLVFYSYRRCGSCRQRMRFHRVPEEPAAPSVDLPVVPGLVTR